MKKGASDTTYTHQTKHHKLSKLNWKSFVVPVIIFFIYFLLGAIFFCCEKPHSSRKMNYDCAIYFWLDLHKFIYIFQFGFFIYHINVAVLVCCWCCLMLLEFLDIIKLRVAWKKIQKHDTPPSVYRYAWNLIFSLLLFRD